MWLATPTLRVTWSPAPLAPWAIRKAMTAMRIPPSQATAATGTASLGPNSFRTSLAGFGALNR
jgi:hypothetical protein